MKVQVDKLSKEVKIRHSRSGGKGGQHVNKVNTKVILAFNIADSSLFDDVQKERILSKLEKRLIDKSTIKISIEDERSQLANHKIGLKRLKQLLEECLKVKKKRLPHKTNWSAKRKRLNDKKNQSDKKKSRSFKPDH